MPVTYATTDGSLTVPDESNRPLHTYHNAIAQRGNVDDPDDIGLTGQGNGIRRIVLPEELSESEQSGLEDYLKTSIELVQDGTS